VTDRDIKIYAQALSRPLAVRNVMHYYEAILVREDHITEADVKGYAGDFQLPRSISTAINKALWGRFSSLGLPVLFDVGDVNMISTAAVRGWEKVTGHVPGDAGFKPNTPARVFPRVSVPVLALLGERDPYLNAALFTNVDEIRSIATDPTTDVRSQILPGHTHWTLEEAPDEIVRAIVSFVKS
jgi:pimeloyl-ACP methyl ester carboxylesterase